MRQQMVPQRTGPPCVVAPCIHAIDPGLKVGLNPVRLRIPGLITNLGKAELSCPAGYIAIDTPHTKNLRDSGQLVVCERAIFTAV